MFIFDLLQQENHTEEGSASGGFQRLLGCQWQCFVLEIFDLNCITWEVQLYVCAYVCLFSLCAWRVKFLHALCICENSGD